jgi:hypothetical protein
VNPDASIKGNDNDADPLRFEPHYLEITSPEQVEIYEAIPKDSAGHVTTGLLSAVGYVKDNRILPSGFNKQTADKDIAVIGEAANDPNFTDKGQSCPLLGLNRRRSRPLPHRGRTLVPTHRIPLGTQPCSVHRSGATTLRELLRLHVIEYSRVAGQGGSNTLGLREFNSGPTDNPLGSAQRARPNRSW